MTTNRSFLRLEGPRNHIVILLAAFLFVFASVATAGDEDGVAGYKIKIFFRDSSGIEGGGNGLQTAADDGLSPIGFQSERKPSEMVIITHYLSELLFLWLR